VTFQIIQEHHGGDKIGFVNKFTAGIVTDIRDLPVVPDLFLEVAKPGKIRQLVVFHLESMYVETFGPVCGFFQLPYPAAYEYPLGTPALGHDTGHQGGSPQDIRRKLPPGYCEIQMFRCNFIPYQHAVIMY